MVVLSRDFWDSMRCCKELEAILGLASHQRIAYLPVFIQSTPGEVREAAAMYGGESFAQRVSSQHSCDLPTCIAALPLCMVYAHACT